MSIFTDNEEESRDLIGLGFNKLLIREDAQSLFLNDLIPPEMRNIFSDGIAPKSIVSGELAAELEQIQRSLHSGKDSFSNADPGYILGIDPSDGNAKFYIGNSTSYLNWDGSTLLLTGSTVSGSTGGFVVTTTRLTGGSFILDSADQYASWGTSNDIMIADANDATYRLWIGNATAGSAPFRVTKGGSVSIGTVDIDAGSIDGTAIGASSASTGRFSSVTATGLTSGRVVFATTNGLLTDDADFTFATDTLTATKISTTELTNSGLVATRVVFAGVGGLLSSDADLTFVTDTLTATKLVGTTSIKVGTAAGYLSSDGSAGATGTFITADGTPKTVTVKDGIITSIV